MIHLSFPFLSTIGASFGPIHSRACETESQTRLTTIIIPKHAEASSPQARLAAASLCLRLYSRGGQRNASQASMSWGIRASHLPSPTLPILWVCKPAANAFKCRALFVYRRYG